MQAREARLGQDVAKVRLSPEKGHLGARGGVCGTPRWLTGACPAPPTSSGTALLRGGQGPWRRWQGCDHPGQLQLRVQAQGSPDCQLVEGPVGTPPACTQTQDRMTREAPAPPDHQGVSEVGTNQLPSRGGRSGGLGRPSLKTLKAGRGGCGAPWCPGRRRAAPLS